MNENLPPPVPVVPGQRGVRLRKIGGTVLALGLIGAGLIWWLGRSPVADDPYALIVADNSKMISHQTQLLYGKMGLLMMDLSDDIQQPGTQAALLGAQRNAKIVGIFVRLCKRDGKPRYLDLIPRVWAQMERDLAHPALADLRNFYDRLIPVEKRTVPHLEKEPA